MNSPAQENKMKNPKENANFWSLYTMLFTAPILKKGYVRDLELTDLYQTLPEHRSDMLGDKIEAAWNIERTTSLLKGKKPSLRRVLIKLFGFKFLCCGAITAFSELFLKMIQPLVLGQLIQYYTPNQREIIKPKLCFFGIMIVLISLLNAFITNPYTMGLVDLGMKIRISCCSLIYRKALKLEKSTLGPTTVGQVVNLISNDVNRFDTFAQFVNFLWITPIQIILVTILVYQLIGIAALAGTISIVVFVPLQLFLGNRAAVLRFKTALRTDERIRLINEIINGIQVIKMYAWENFLGKLVDSARRFEIESIRKNSYILGILSALNLIVPRISIYATIFMYVLFNDNIHSAQVFVITAFYNILRTSVSVYFAYGIGKTSETNISIKRINRFLLLEENNSEIFSNTFDANTKEHEEYAVTITNGVVKWSKNLKENSLSDLSLSVKRGSLLGVIGPVGSGKSTLLYTILREFPLITGTLQVCGKVSYASQEPWIFSGTIRQNILFGLPMDHLRYKTVLRKCALKEDLIRFPYGDKTIIGDEGTFLSACQKVKINLARAVYRDADIYLLDDPLSSVDARVGKQLFEDCIWNFLKEKTVILVTHQLQYLSDVENVIILDNGEIKSQGGFYELTKSGINFVKLLGDKKIVEEVKDVSMSFSLADVNSVEAPIVEENKSGGPLSSALYKMYFCIGSSLPSICLVVALFIFAQGAASGSDFFLSYWVNQEQQLAKADLNKSASIDKVQNDNHALHGFYSSLSQYFTYKSINIYSICMAVLIIISISRSFAYYAMCMRSSINLHDKAFESVSHAHMAFFNINTPGRILNRFSRDIGSVDELLPSNMMDALTNGLTVFGVIVVVCIANSILLIPTIIFTIIFYKIKNFYITTISNVKRLEGITKSPLFTHLKSSLQGLITIRAAGVQDLSRKEFDSHQDLHSSAWHLYLVTARAFGFCLDLLCVAYIAVVTFSFFISSNPHLCGNVGLAITQVLGLTGMLQWGVRQSTEVVNQMTSVERILEYINVDHESALESEPDLKPKQSWPNKGKIRFIDVQLRYSSHEAPVLKKLNFTIQPEEKIGIVGRTGAGKTSLIAALFRLAETKGFIIIDGVVIQRIGLHDLRSKISIIPQNPVIFSGTLRKNLDPFDDYTDAVLWNALEEVNLKEVVEDLILGLNTLISGGGINFSVGQRQLICLAQTVIRKNKILILDEATVNVDPQTLALIQSTIKRNFSNCTVLTISHRLDSLMDSDKVLVMDEGRVVEFGRPYELLQNSLGYFYKMVVQEMQCRKI